MTTEIEPDLLVPPAMVPEILAAAAEEHRPVDDVLRGIIGRGLEERRWRRVLALGKSVRNGLA